MCGLEWKQRVREWENDSLIWQYWCTNSTIGIYLVFLFFFSSIIYFSNVWRMAPEWFDSYNYFYYYYVYLNPLRFSVVRVEVRIDAFVLRQNVTSKTIFILIKLLISKRKSKFFTFTIASNRLILYLYNIYWQLVSIKFRSWLDFAEL